MVHVRGPYRANGVAGLFAPEQGKDIPHNTGVAAAVTGLDASAVAVLIHSCPLLGVKGEQLDIAVHATYQLTLGTEDPDEATALVKGVHGFFIVQAPLVKLLELTSLYVLLCQHVAFLFY